MLTDEEERALAWQRRQRRIAAFQRALRARLRGDPARLRQWRDDWRPLILARQEARQWPVDPADDPAGGML